MMNYNTIIILTFCEYIFILQLTFWVTSLAGPGLFLGVRLAAINW